MTTDRDELIQREREFWHAAGDPRFYERHFAEEGRCVFSVGILDKPATVASMDGATEWAEVTMDEVEVVELADDVAAVVYAASARDTDGDGYEANVSSVYVRRDGDWRLTIHQQTPRA